MHGSSEMIMWWNVKKHSYVILAYKYPDSKVHGANMCPVGSRWPPFWPHEPCHQGIFTIEHCLAVLLSEWLWINENPAIEDQLLRTDSFSKCKQLHFCDFIDYAQTQNRPLYDINDCMTAISPAHLRGRYCCLALSHRYNRMLNVSLLGLM